MRTLRKIAHKAEVAKGSAKRLLGHATGNNRLKVTGRVDQVKGHTKQAGATLKNAFKP